MCPEWTVSAWSSPDKYRLGTLHFELSGNDLMWYLRLAFLAPDIVEAILQGRQPAGISLRKLTNGKQLPSSWIEQRRLLNFPSL